MKIREIQCKRWLLSKWIDAITIYPFIFYNKPERFTQAQFKKLQKHEMVHIKQVEDLGWLKFYGSYLWASVVKRIPYRKNKYEKEAYGDKDGH